MPDDIFPVALRHAFTWEGVDSWDAAGGPTRFGISQAAFPGLNIHAVTRASAEQIYREHYWEKMRCSELPAGLAVMAFDCAVNQGVPRATRLLQKAAGVVVDENIGPATLAAIADEPALDLLRWFTVLRLCAYATTKGFATYGRGWVGRTLDCYDLAVSLSKA